MYQSVCFQGQWSPVVTGSLVHSVLYLSKENFFSMEEYLLSYSNSLCALEFEYHHANFFKWHYKLFVSNRKQRIYVTIFYWHGSFGLVTEISWPDLRAGPFSAGEAMKGKHWNCHTFYFHGEYKIRSWNCG